MLLLNMEHLKLEDYNIIYINSIIPSLIVKSLLDKGKVSKTICLNRYINLIDVLWLDVKFSKHRIK